MAWADLSDCRCYYELLGSGEPLVLIPGLATTCRLWDGVSSDFAQFFSVIQFDNRGIGKSLAKRKPTTLRDLASDIIELLDYLQLDHAHVLGVSMGGIIAQRLAIDHPSRVDRLVLVSCADSFSPYLRQMSGLLAQTLRRFPMEMFVRTVELLATAPEFLDSNGELVEQRVSAKCRSRVSARAVGTQFRCLAASESDPLHDRIFAPTLVIAGEYDPIIPGCYSKRMAERIPDSEFFLVSGAGHNPIVDHPQTVLPRVIDFLRRKDESSNLVLKHPLRSGLPLVGGSLPI